MGTIKVGHEGNRSLIGIVENEIPPEMSCRLASLLSQASRQRGRSNRCAFDLAQPCRSLPYETRGFPIWVQRNDQSILRQKDEQKKAWLAAFPFFSSFSSSSSSFSGRDPRLSSSTSFMFYWTVTPRCEEVGQSSLQCAWKTRLLHLGYMERFTNTKKGGRIDVERCRD